MGTSGGCGEARRLAGAAPRGKLASGGIGRHHWAMRFIPAFVALSVGALFTASCATTPAPTPPPPPAVIVPPAPTVRGELIGLTAGELVQRLGTPALQVREGAGLKLQFRGSNCIIDAYLYTPASGLGVERVTHVDARLHSGADTDQRGCVAALEGA
ncbi:MAG: hypothetical protein ABI626_07860 [Sphingomicrobium sp.]